MFTPRLNDDRYALKRFINRYNIHSYSHLIYYRSVVANNLLHDIMDADSKKKVLKQKMFPAHDTQTLNLKDEKKKTNPQDK